MNSLTRAMRPVLVAAALALAASFSSALAQSPSAVTATCKDGTNFSGKSKRGACAHHGGVKAFTTTKAESAPAAPVASSPAAPATALPAPAPKAVAAGKMNGSAQVWVNPASKVYHCPGTRFHGKTKAGEYMSEAAAKAKGYRPSRGQACS